MGSVLRNVAAYYSEKYGETVHSAERLRQIYNDYIKERHDSLIDAISATVALNAIFFTDQIDPSTINPQMEEAFQLAFPNRSIEDLNGLSPESAEGWLQAWKGKLFEVQVRDRLNTGEAVGDVQLGPGQIAKLADKPNQSGWDLQILDQDGGINEHLQLKATQSLGYIKGAIVRNPDIPVLGTDEVATEAAQKMVDNVLNSGISESDLRDQIAEPLEDLLDSPLEEFVESILPGLPFILIATTEGAKVLMGRQALQEALNQSLERGIKSGIAIGVGSTAAALTGAGLVSLPATFVTRLGINRYQIMKGLSRRMETDIYSLRTLQENIT